MTAMNKPEQDALRETAIAALSKRSRDVLRHVIEHYMESGEPVGSRTISRVGGVDLSPASIRNVMSDLEDVGLLFAPHASAGRLPTDLGMRLFVDGLLEVGRLTEQERADIESRCAAKGANPNQVLELVSQSLAGLTRHAGLVVAPKTEAALKHIEFVNLRPGRSASPPRRWSRPGTFSPPSSSAARSERRATRSRPS